MPCVECKKTTAEFFRKTQSTLLRYNNVGTLEDVADLWGRIAKEHKREYHVIIRQEFMKVCVTRHLSTEVHVPVITTTLKQMITNLQFVSYGVDDLMSGCQPFVVAYSGDANYQVALSAAKVANLLGSKANPALEDVRAIKAQEKVAFPTTLFDVNITLAHFAVLCQTLFQGIGPPHPLVECMWSFYEEFNNAMPELLNRYNQVAHVPTIVRTYHARILRCAQVNVHEYFKQVGANLVNNCAGVTVPSLGTLLTDLRRGTLSHTSNWIPLPPAYLEAPSGRCLAKIRTYRL